MIIRFKHHGKYIKIVRVNKRNIYLYHPILYYENISNKWGENMSNFSFLNEKYPSLSKLREFEEKYI